MTPGRAQGEHSASTVQRDPAGTTVGTPTRDKRVVLVAAYARNGVIGRDGDVPWHIPADLRHFRETTTGHTVVMGRVTYEGIGRPLPYRTNVVVTRDPDWRGDGVFVASSLAEALELARDFPGDIVIAGGAQVYAAALPLATHQVLTEIDQEPRGDTYYPPFDATRWRETAREEHEGYRFRWLERVGMGSAADDTARQER